MNKLEKLVGELVDMSGPCNPKATREAWERHVKDLCGQIFNQGMGVGWDKHVAVAEAREVRKARVARYQAGLCICDDANGSAGCPVHDPDSGRMPDARR